MPDPLTIDVSTLAKLAHVVHRTVGFRVTPDVFPGLRLALKARMVALGQHNAHAYLEALSGEEGEAELRALIPLVSVGKTEFFRDWKQIQAFEHWVLPRVLADARAEGRRALVWSAGCATGEEPYTLAMAALEQGARSEELVIRASDVNGEAIAVARQGVYATKRLVGVNLERRLQFFKRLREGWSVVRRARDLVQFETHNLAATAWPTMVAGDSDVIFCRNVLIYFAAATVAGVIERLFEVLRPGGLLFLGYSESLCRPESRFETVEIGGAFALRRPVGVPPLRSARPALTTPSTSKVAWSEPRAHARFNGGTPERPAGPVVVSDPIQSLGRLLARGQTRNALVEAVLLTEREPENVAAWLVVGSVELHLGRVLTAKAAFERAIQVEPLTCEAWLGATLVSLHVGDFSKATIACKRLLFLESHLAQGYYLLGQAAEGLDEAAAACRAYRTAISERRSAPPSLVGIYPDLPLTGEAIELAALYRLAALSEDE
jgi:chemotaxis protein methyltransferase CheR